MSLELADRVFARAADAHDAGLDGLGVISCVFGKAADAHDAGFVVLEGRMMLVLWCWERLRASACVFGAMTDVREVGLAVLGVADRVFSWVADAHS